ncbi:MAG TPA: AGE family epimerase/isomerase, partial [Spirochaetota bacterium]
GFEGYYEMADEDWSHPLGKGFTPTVDGITTHGLSLYLLTGEQRYKDRLVQLADNIVQHIYPTMKTRKSGFEEQYDSDWKETMSSFYFVGHVLKTSWCLQRAYLINPKPEYKNAAEAIMQDEWKKEWDLKYGGPFLTGNNLSGTITNHDKNYWVIEQGITSGLINYYVTKNPLFLKMADQSADFFEKYIEDKKNGEVIDTVSVDGSERIVTDKGSYWKSGYHAMETGYFIYLYGNLYLKNKPVTLYYWIDKSKKNRSIPLNPVEIEPGVLVISDVFLNDKKYSAYNAKTRILTVPAGTEGEFRVTFSRATPTK